MVGPGRQEQGLDGTGCFSLECTGEDQAHALPGHPHPRN